MSKIEDLTNAVLKSLNAIDVDGREAVQIYMNPDDWQEFASTVADWPQPEEPSLWNRKVNLVLDLPRGRAYVGISV